MTMTDLQARFLPGFLTMSRERIARAEALLTAGTPDALLALGGELHTLAGEAAMLGLPAIADSARQVESVAKGRQAPVGQSVAEACAAGLGRLAQAIAEISAARGADRT